MKIVLSPAKSLNTALDVAHQPFSQFIFQKEALQIDVKLKKLKPKQLMELMEISDKLAELNWQRNQERDLKNITPENAKQAIYMFDGDVYDGFDAYTLPENAIEIMQDNIRILSGLYGLLKPLDLIQPYRMEMGKQLVVGTHKNLYEFWKKKITKQLNSELGKTDFLINLASNEYFSAVDKKELKASIITPEFKDYKDGQLKMISFFAKKARGMMARYIVENNIENVEDIKKFNTEGYQYDANLSKGNNWVFTR